MPEEPDVSPQEQEILDRNIRKRIEAKKQQREREAGQVAAQLLEEAAASVPSRDGLKIVAAGTENGLRAKKRN